MAPIGLYVVDGNSNASDSQPSHLLYSVLRTPSRVYMIPKLSAKPKPISSLIFIEA